MSISFTHESWLRRHFGTKKFRRLIGGLAPLIGCAILVASVDQAYSQDDVLHPGEAFVTRFSGTVGGGDAARIDVDGTVGSIIDLRAPSQPPSGQHWLNEPQRLPVTAKQVGQVFGVAIDDDEQPNIYVTATSAFGLHHDSGGAWMAGMWGERGGPGTVYKLNANNGYKPEIFADIKYAGRENTGAALGTVAYDAINKQLFVSDLETGMIHRLRATDGQDLERYDHGAIGRLNFFDAEAGADASLPAVSFSNTSRARVSDCPDGDFDKTVSCWNVADFRRRVWGLGVRQDPATGEVRLYYSVWSGEALGSADFAGADANEKRNSIWSVGIKEDGSFDTGSVVREFFLPEFYTDDAAAVKSHPVTDIAFPKCNDQITMLLSERGGLLNLGLGAENAFAKPFESRVLRYLAGEDGTWSLEGRYPVGHYARADRQAPKIRANSAGGVDFGYGYSSNWRVDLNKPDEFVWMSGDALCAPFAPCFNPQVGRHTDGSQVHGVQGNEADKFKPDGSAADTASTPLPAWMVDTDINVDGSNKPIMSELTRNDATRIGDIAIYQPCDAQEAADAGSEEEPPVEEVTPPTDGVLPPDGPPIEEPEPDLEKSKTGPAECVEGGLCTFTITITNNGPGVWSGPLFEHDTLPPGATLANYGPQPDWICTQAGDSVDCEHATVNLVAGDSVTLTLDVMLPPGLLGEVENCVFDVWQPSGPNDDALVIEAIEQRLNALGFNPGPIDGVLDAQTQAAITDYQNANGLDPTGDVTDELRESLFPGMAGLPGDADPTNDSDCHVVQVVPPPPPLPPQPIVQPPVPPAPPPIILPTPPAPPIIIDLPPIRTWCPPGTIRRHGQCVRIIRRCPEGTVLRHGQCIRVVRSCPPGTVRRHGQCIRIERRCPPGTVLRHGRCVRVVRTCPPGTVRRHGQCVRTVRRCPEGTILRRGRCVKITRHCPTGTVRRGNRCVRVGDHHVRPCPQGTVRRGNRCVKIAGTHGVRCPRGTIKRGNRCVRVKGRTIKRCPPGTLRRGNRCVRIGKKSTHSHSNRVRRNNASRLRAIQRKRAIQQRKAIQRRRAVKRCPRGTVRRGNRCVRVRSH